jgi:MFS family permease
MPTQAPDNPPNHGFAAYKRVLAAPHVLPLVLISVLARLPVGMNALILVIYVHGATGSFAAAGLVAGAYTLGLGLTGPLLARLIDRRGSRLVILPAALIASAALAGVVVLGHADAGPLALALAAAAAGCATPPVGGVMRQRLPGLVSAHDLPTVYALDSIGIEVIFIAGPLLAGILAATVGAGTGVLVAAALGSLGSAWFAAIANTSPSYEEERRSHGWAGALASPTLRFLVFTGVPVGATFGALDVALPAFGAAHGNAALGGPFAASLAIGSAIGGIAYGARPHAFGSQARTFFVLGGAQALTCLPIIFVVNVPEMFLAAAVAGIFVAPLITIRNQLAKDGMLVGTGTEAFTWLGLSMTIGASAGAALAGPLVESAGWRAGAIAACLIPGLAIGVAYAGRGTLPAAAARSPSAPRSAATASAISSSPTAVEIPNSPPAP